MLRYGYFYLLILLIGSCSLSANDEAVETPPKSNSAIFEVESEILYPGKVLSFERQSGLLSLYVRERPKYVPSNVHVKYNVRFKVLSYEAGDFIFLGQEKVKTIHDWKMFNHFSEGEHQRDLFKLGQELFTKEFFLSDGRRLLVATTKADLGEQLSYVQLGLGNDFEEISTMGILHFADIYEYEGEIKLILASTYCAGKNGCSDSLMVLNLLTNVK